VIATRRNMAGILVAGPAPDRFAHLRLRKREAGSRKRE